MTQGLTISFLWSSWKLELIQIKVFLENVICRKKKKRLKEWLSACLASVRTWVQTPLPPKERKKEMKMYSSQFIVRRYSRNNHYMWCLFHHLSILTATHEEVCY
jgi:hypothetical protein